MSVLLIIIIIIISIIIIKIMATIPFSHGVVFCTPLLKQETFISYRSSSWPRLQKEMHDLERKEGIRK